MLYPYSLEGWWVSNSHVRGNAHLTKKVTWSKVSSVPPEGLVYPRYEDVCPEWVRVLGTGNPTIN